MPKPRKIKVKLAVSGTWHAKIGGLFLHLPTLTKYLFILFMGFGVYVNAQNPVSLVLGSQSGLPANAVYNMLQDQKGFIWIGHDKGLSRFDGSTFRHYTASGQQGKSISNLMEVHHQVWCQDFSGNFYYTEGDRLCRETAFKSTGTYAPAGAMANQTVLLVNYDSLKCFDLRRRTTTALVSSEGMQQAVFHSSTENVSYFLKRKSLCQYNGTAVSVLYSFPSELPSRAFLIKCGARFYAFGRKEAPFCYQLTASGATPLPVLGSARLIQDVTLVENEIWVSTTSGAYAFDTLMQPLYGGRCFFPEHSVTQILKDREGNYWFGTLNTGLLMVSDMHALLVRYPSEIVTALSLYKNQQILVGTSASSVFVFDPQKRTSQPLITHSTKEEILALYYDADRETIISCANAVRFYHHQNKIYEENLAGKQLCTLDDHTYVLAFSGGVTLLGRSSTRVMIPDWLRPYTSQNESRSFLTQRFRGRAVLFDEVSHTLYTATAEGLRYYHPRQSGFIQFEGKHLYCTSLCLVGGRLFAGTFSDGLFVIEGGNATLLNRLTPGLTPTVYRLCASGDDLWIVGDELLQRYQTRTGELSDFTVADGLPKTPINDVLVQHNTVFVATPDGLVLLNASKKSVNETRPLLELTGIWVNEQAVDPDHLLRMQPNENNIRLDLALLSFRDNKAATISYRINQEAWKTLPRGARSLQFASLAAGAYDLEITATNEDGVPCRNNVLLRLNIAAPLYRQPWFIGLVLSAIVAAMYVYFRQKLRLEQKNNELMAQKLQLEQELQKSMLTSIKSQMNPHFLFNALNTIQSYIYTNDKENASLYLGKFSDLTRIILEMSSRESVLLDEELKALVLYIELEQIRFEDKLHYHLSVDEQLQRQSVHIPSMLIQPYVENAIKHGLMHSKNQWQLDISFEKTGDSIQVVIDDNGIGRKASAAINAQRYKKHQSFATGANQKRLEILNKGLRTAIGFTIEDKTNAYGQPTGTRVILRIPILNNAN
jgi:ligand-binding sensor domain-containing protein